MVKIIVLFVLLLLPSCGLIPTGVPSLGIEATMGDKEESLIGNIGDNHEVTSESISGGVNTNIITDSDPMMLWMLLIGWLIASPKDIWKGIKEEVKGWIMFWKKKR